MKRKMTVSYCADKQKPMIRITNFFLLKSGFKVGDKIDVEYQDNQLIIKKINQKQIYEDNLQTRR